jgi:galactokinase
MGAMVAAAPRADRRVRVRSINLGEAMEFDLDGPPEARRGIWLDYVEGMARVLEARGIALTGAELVVQSDVPLGAGLSSSASFEIAVGLALLSLADRRVDALALAHAGQAAEHDYVGTNCGIMDQYTAALARAGCALLIDCRSLQSSLIPIDFSRVAIVVCDTRVKHALASTAYNLRRAECERGVEFLQASLPYIRSLRDVSREEFAALESSIPESIGRRCRHVVTENARTLAAGEALGAGDFEGLGRLMRLSHESLRNDYEVSCAELDLMVEIAASVEGVIGARMTGAGFGGCTVNFLNRNAVEGFRQTVSREYNKATGITPAIYVSEAGDSAREIGPGVEL